MVSIDFHWLSAVPISSCVFLELAWRFQNRQRMNSDKNLTVALLDYHNGILNFSGQHEEIIVVRIGGHIERIDTIDMENSFPINECSMTNDQ